MENYSLIEGSFFACNNKFRPRGKSAYQSTVRLLEMRYTILRNLNLQFLY